MLSDKDPVYLVFDTNVFLAPPNTYHDNLTKDHRSALQLLKAIHGGERGSLPLISVRIPWIVRLELLGLSQRDPYSWYSPESRSAKATDAIEYLDYITYEPNGIISYQTCLEHQEAKKFQKKTADKDELVLLCCLQARENYSRNVWLVTNDVRLSARAMRSQLGTLTFSALKHAMTLRNGEDAVAGDTFIDEVPSEWMCVRSELDNLWTQKANQEGCQQEMTSGQLAASPVSEGRSTTSSRATVWFINFKNKLLRCGTSLLRTGMRPREHGLVLVWLFLELCIQVPGPRR